MTLIAGKALAKPVKKALKWLCFGNGVKENKKDNKKTPRRVSFFSSDLN